MYSKKYKTNDNLPRIQCVLRSAKDTRRFIEIFGLGSQILGAVDTVGYLHFPYWYLQRHKGS